MLVASKYNTQKGKQWKLLKKQMTKKAYKDLQKKNRVLVNFNTGTRSHKSPKDYDRNREKAEIRKEL